MVTYVPGTFAKLGSIDGDIGRAVALQSEAERHDLAHSTASVVWLGYDAPQAIMSDATETEWADKAEEPLGNFLQGIEEANHRDVNQTLLGHSYGSLVAGQTMSTHIDLPVDNAIMVGSPGVGVDHAKDLNIPADHVFAATAKNDLINLAPPLAGPLAPSIRRRTWSFSTTTRSFTEPTRSPTTSAAWSSTSPPGGTRALVAKLCPRTPSIGTKPVNKLARIVTGGQP